MSQKNALPRVTPAQFTPLLIAGLCLAGCGTTPLARVPVDPNIQGTALPCDIWSEPQLQGMLDHTIIPEASGIAVSKAFEDRIYHNNDSGDGPYFYVTNAAGTATQTVTVEGFDPSDVEAMALGPCPEQGDCLYLGDIGDNAKAREDIKIVIVPEQKQFAGQAAPIKIVTAKYPDTSHDAEGMAVHPNGDLFILTKEYNWLTWRAFPAQLYRLSAAQMAASDGDVQELEHIGELDLPYLLGRYGFLGQQATGLDISSDGQRAVVLTYRTALELMFEPLRNTLGEGYRISDENFRIIPIEELPQMEAIAYAADQNAFIYNTEYHEEFGGVPIYQVSCLNLRSDIAK